MKQETNGMVGTEWQVVATPGEDPLRDTQRMKDVKQWLKEYEGFGMYYIDDIFGQVYLERDEDREMFLLRWS